MQSTQDILDNPPLAPTARPAATLDAPWKLPPTPDPLQAIKERVLQHFNTAAQPLFAILDGARNERIVALLKEFGVPANVPVNSNQLAEKRQHDEPLYQSLYIWKMALESAEQGPFLVRLPPESPLLKAVVMEGWGDSWGIFVESAVSFDDLWRHSRKFIMVEMPGGKTALFRFYDPRALRAFLPSCDQRQIESIFAIPIRIHIEDSEGQLMRFSHQHATGIGCQGHVAIAAS